VDQIETTFTGLAASAAWLPDWVISLALFALALIAAVAAHRIVFRWLTRLVAPWDLFWRSLVSRTEGPTRLGMVMVALSFAATVAPLTSLEAEVIRHGLLVAFIALVGWLALAALHIWTTVYLRRFKLDSEDNLLARKHVTQSRILRRVMETLIIVIAFAAALMTFESVRQYGVSLLASAGAAGLVIGLALQPLLKNLIAGIQLAVTQPIRLDDAVIVENEWGNVEDITATYVVVRLWDWRRMVLPLSYFIEKPFQNWTRETSSLIGTVMMYVDYTVPVPELREYLAKIAAETPLWDGQVVNLQVTDLKENTMEIRMLVSAANAGRAFDLRCEVREKMIAFVQQRFGSALPRQRTDITGHVAAA
jgi:small-conductance mechanosensitive channel